MNWRNAALNNDIYQHSKSEILRSFWRWEGVVDYENPTSYELVDEFHDLFGHPIRKPLEEADVKLAIKLIEEETKELVEALWNSLQQGKLTPNTLKEHGDLRYVLSGLAVRLGYDEEECVRRVHDSNMSKLNTDGKPLLREDGKILKGPNYYEPDLTDLLP